MHHQFACFSCRCRKGKTGCRKRMHGFSKQQEDVSKDLTGMTEIHFLPDIQWERIVALMRFRSDTEEKKAALVVHGQGR